MTVRALVAIAACALALARPSAARAEPAAPAEPTDFVFFAGLGGGVEAGLSHGKPGLLELETGAGFDIGATAAGAGLVIRPELALALGMAPDLHVAVRPGVRVAVPGTPLWLRGAIDWSNARDHSTWRWALVGLAWEVRMTSVLGFSFEADTGAALSSSAGLPLILRASATFRP